MITVDKVIEKINNGEFDEAYRHIHTIQNSGLEDDIFVLAEKLSEMGFLEQAYQLYEQLLAVHPDEGELLLSLAEILIELDREDEALDLVKKVKKDDPVYPSALLLEADLYALTGMEEVAYNKLKEAKKIMPDEPLVDFALGEQCYMQGSFLEAIECFESVLKTEDEVAGISINQRIAESYSNMGKFEEALPYYDKSLKQKTELHTLFQYGLTAFQAGQYQTAVDKLTELKQLDHEYHSLYLYLASAYEQLNDYKNAYEVVKEGIKQDEFNKELYFKAGKMSMKLQKEEQAISYFRQAIALDPGYLEANITLAKLFIAKEMYEDCIETIESVQEFGENDPQFAWLLAQCYHGLEEYDKARSCYEEAYETYKENTDFLLDYGYFSLEEGNRAITLEIFKTLLESDPWNEEYLSVIEQLEN
ncbi:tetratricopeptide repeat protein [Bacillus testis]|uniref:tetratricopeptide repeat protein n=1 Tax=Bacillus testis TaxID=1622072 RepID=UPI00067EB3A1|nr:tetratricopeptide repeat protein [Bacillus testis]